MRVTLTRPDVLGQRNWFSQFYIGTKSNDSPGCLLEQAWRERLSSLSLLPVTPGLSGMSRLICASDFIALSPVYLDASSALPVGPAAIGFRVHLL